VRTFRTYATARTYPLSAPISAPGPEKHQVKRVPIKNFSDSVLSQVGFDDL